MPCVAAMRPTSVEEPAPVPSRGAPSLRSPCPPPSFANEPEDEARFGHVPQKKKRRKPRCDCRCAVDAPKAVPVWIGCSHVYAACARSSGSRGRTCAMMIRFGELYPMVMDLGRWKELHGLDDQRLTFLCLLDAALSTTIGGFSAGSAPQRSICWSLCSPAIISRFAPSRFRHFDSGPDRVNVDWIEPRGHQHGLVRLELRRRSPPGAGGYPRVLARGGKRPPRARRSRS